MSTHNIGFYEDLTKIIFELSSNIIKYAPYFFCCSGQSAHHLAESHDAKQRPLGQIFLSVPQTNVKFIYSQ